MNPVVLGAIIAASSGLATKALDHLLSRDSRKRELLAERRLSATEEAYWRAKVIASLADSAAASELFQRIVANDEWFFRHCMHLPNGFGDAWLTLRNRALLLHQRERRKNVSEDCANEMTDLAAEIDHWSGECLRLLNASLKKPELTVVPWTRPPTADKQQSGSLGS